LLLDHKEQETNKGGKGEEALPLQLVGGVSDVLFDVGEGNSHTGNIDDIKHL
jgi:hypothetical protein